MIVLALLNGLEPLLRPIFSFQLFSLSFDFDFLSSFVEFEKLLESFEMYPLVKVEADLCDLRLAGVWRKESTSLPAILSAYGRVIRRNRFGDSILCKSTLLGSA